MKKTFSLILLATLPACASIVEGSEQEIMVETAPPMTARCELTNERGTWHVAATPGNVALKRSGSDLHVECANNTHEGKRIFSSDAESWAVGNVLAGGIIGAGVDAGTGALYSYDDVITVPMKARGLESNAIPSIQPNIQGYYGTQPASPAVSPSSNGDPAWIHNSPQPTTPYYHNNPSPFAAPR